MLDDNAPHLPHQPEAYTKLAYLALGLAEASAHHDSQNNLLPEAKHDLAVLLWFINDLSPKRELQFRVELHGSFQKEFINLIIKKGINFLHPLSDKTLQSDALYFYLFKEKDAVSFSKVKISDRFYFYFDPSIMKESFLNEDVIEKISSIVKIDLERISSLPLLRKEVSSLKKKIGEYRKEALTTKISLIDLQEKNSLERKFINLLSSLEEKICLEIKDHNSLRSDAHVLHAPTLEKPLLQAKGKKTFLVQKIKNLLSTVTSARHTENTTSEPPAFLASDTGNNSEKTPCNNTLASPDMDTDTEGRHSSLRCVLFIAGEPETPGVNYRCIRNAQAAADAGYETRILSCEDVSYHDLVWADVAILWRVEFSGHVSILLDLAKKENVITVFDTDDIVFVPHYARIDLIDGIRSIGATEARIERNFAEMRRTLARCDQGAATTLELAREMHALRPVVHLLPNVYERETLRRSRRGLRLRGQPGQCLVDTDLIRIGYATGSRTHQRDFTNASKALAEVLALRPNARLVLFRERENHRPILLMEEFPELQPFENQIEWRDMVPLAALADEFARLDISIAPLESNNTFCEAKSEVKFLEASLAGAASIVAPTGPFRRVVRRGITGLFAETVNEWRDALLTLIDRPDVRSRMARDAYHDTLFPFGPAAQIHRIKCMLRAMEGEEQATQAGERLLADAQRDRAPLPTIPESETLFHQDLMGDAAVTVVITSYNYAPFILEALHSVLNQTENLLDLVVVDDCSTDDSADLVKIWMERHAERFNRLILRRTLVNAGLGGARNVGMDAAETPYILQLDADNRLRPDACTHLAAAMTPETAFVYPKIVCFDENGLVTATHDPDFPVAPGTPLLISDLPHNPLALVSGNRVDAMALIAKWAWAAAGGYYVSRDAMGWEDFDLWCTFAERGFLGRHVPEILADYRYHAASMTNASTERAAHKARVVDYIKKRHPWVHLTAALAQQRL